MKLNRLRILRTQKHFTCSDMSDFLNISKAFYWQIEQGERKLSYDMAVKIADVFKRKPDYIFYNDFKNKD